MLPLGFGLWALTWVRQRLVEAGLLRGKTVAIDATTLEANAAMRSIVRPDTGERYQEYGRANGPSPNENSRDGNGGRIIRRSGAIGHRVFSGPLSGPPGGG